MSSAEARTLGGIVGIEDDGTYALIVVGDHARTDYVQRLRRLGLTAKAYADKHGVTCHVVPAPQPKLKLQAYADNFR